MNVTKKTYLYEAVAKDQQLDSGLTLSPVTIAYETLGTLNKSKDNAILICHAFSGDSHE